MRRIPRNKSRISLSSVPALPSAHSTIPQLTTGLDTLSTVKNSKCNDHVESFDARARQRRHDNFSSISVRERLLMAQTPIVDAEHLLPVTNDYSLKPMPISQSLPYP
jgi:hypothetical protein